MNSFDERVPKVGRPKSFDREEVLDLAINAFGAHGYEGTSIQDLVDAMGINRFSLYDTFGDKHNLMLEALDRYQSQRRAAATELFSQPGPRLPLLKAYYEAIWNDAQAGIKRAGCLMVNSAVELARTDPEIASRAAHHFALLEEIFLRALTEAVENGEIEVEEDLRAIARFLLNGARGLRVVVRYANDRNVFEDVFRVTFSVLKVKAEQNGSLPEGFLSL